MAMNANMAIQIKAEVGSITNEVPRILISWSRVLDTLVGPRV